MVEPQRVGLLEPAAPLSTTFRAAVAAELNAFLAGQSPVLAAMGDEVGVLQAMATELLAGGKRLRPAFCVWSWVAATGELAVPRSVLAVAASLEVLHVSALVHDDVMDASDLRRGFPTAHRQFEALHRGSGWVGDPTGFGRAGAILLGDLLVMWSTEMAQRAALAPDAAQRAHPILAATRTEVTCGQYLDIVAQVRPLAADGVRAALAEAGRVVDFKSARYSVQRPCQLGAAVGRADVRLQTAMAAYGSPLGRAFQFRDDLLGVFGEPTVTGKPAGDDLREGKRTVVVAHALARADASGRALLVTRLGDPDLDRDGIAALQEVIAESGARDAVEAMISAGHDEALAALDSADISDAGRTALTALADLAVRRDV